MFVEFRLTRVRKNAYLNNLLGDANDSSQYDDDSDDEDWLPKESMYLWRFSYKIKHAFSTFYIII